MGARAAGADAELTQNGVAAIAHAMGGFGGGADANAAGAGPAAGVGAGVGPAAGANALAGGFDRDGPAAGVGPAAGANAERTPHCVVAIAHDMGGAGRAGSGGDGTGCGSRLRDGRSVAPRIRSVPVAPPQRVVRPRLMQLHAKASPAPQTRSTSSRRGSGAFNQACVLLFFHRKGN